MNYSIYQGSTEKKKRFLGDVTSFVLRSNRPLPHSGSNEAIFLCNIRNFRNSSSKNVTWTCSSDSFSGCRLFV